jgi:AcrR family transcriptional regulator
MKRQEYTRRRRREMLAAYYQVLVDEGLQGASVAKIAKQIGVPPSLLIHYFGTKEQMTIELVDYLLEREGTTYAVRLATIADPLARLHATLDMLFSPEYHQLLDDSAFYACFYLSLRQAPVRQAFANLAAASLAFLEAVVAECMKAGYVPADDARQVATVIKAMEEGYAFLIAGWAASEQAVVLGNALKRRVLTMLGLAAASPPPLSESPPLSV